MTNDLENLQRMYYTDCIPFLLEFAAGCLDNICSLSGCLQRWMERLRSSSLRAQHTSPHVYILGCPPPVTVANEGLGWDSLLKIQM